MRRIKQSPSIQVAILFAVSVFCATADANIKPLDSAFNALVDNGDIPGAVILVQHQGDLIHEGVYGLQDVEFSKPMQKDTIFRIASQTKAVVSVAVMMLQEDGQLLIDEPVGNYIPEYLQTVVSVDPASNDGVATIAANRPITIRDLLTHTAGIDYGGTFRTRDGLDPWGEAGIQGWYFAHRTEPILETIKKIGGLPHAAQPGEQFVYGYNTDILGALVEVVSGESLESFLENRIFAPLNMSDTHFYLPKNKRHRLATVYGLKDGKLSRAPNESTMTGQGGYIDGPRTSFSGGAGLLSTASDYLKFLTMMHDEGTVNGQKILSRKTIELMTVDHLGDIPFSPGSGFGLGFRILKDIGRAGVPGSVGAYSWGGAYHTTYWVDPTEQLIVTYMTQVIPAGGLRDHAMLNTLVYQHLK